MESVQETQLHPNSTKLKFAFVNEIDLIVKSRMPKPTKKQVMSAISSMTSELEGAIFASKKMEEMAESLVESASGTGALTEVEELRLEVQRLTERLNKPEFLNFIEGVQLEAAHQLERWEKDDENKGPESWYWLLGYLAGKALHNLYVGDKEKSLHHIVSSAAALANWHARVKKSMK